MALADDLKNDIAALLDDPDFGRNIVLHQQTQGTYDEATGAMTGESDETWPARAIFLAYKDYLLANNSVQAGDRKCILKVLDLTYQPKEGDRVVAGPDEYTVISFKTGELGGTAYLYTLQVRR
jgi:hypothetical protein